MITINYSIRPYIKVLHRNSDTFEEGGQVAIRVRWNKSKCEVSFYTSVYANTGKWDADLKRAVRGTVHLVNGTKYSYNEINNEIAEYRELIESAFDEFALRNSVPTNKNLKDKVNGALGKTVKKVEVAKVKNTMQEMMQLFLLDCGREKNWNALAKEKYTQAFMHITKANPGITPYDISIEHMYRLRTWYIDNKYRNRTINKQITMLKGFLKWLNNQNGITVPPQVLNFETNLKVLRKTVTFLHYDELMHFAHFNYNGNKRLQNARDYWCFMAFTSLRVSDLIDLKRAHIHNGRIEKNAIKTGEQLSIPLVEEALLILERHKDDNAIDHKVFDIPSAQKLNDAVKDAARAAGLDREIVETYYIGTERIEEVHKFYEIISNHDGRRTFVSCSLAMGIPPEVVMKSTGHKSYNTMKPYIETATETQELEMEKWNSNQYRSQILQILEGADENTLRDFLEYAKKVV